MYIFWQPLVYYSIYDAHFLYWNRNPFYRVDFLILFYKTWMLKDIRNTHVLSELKSIFLAFCINFHLSLPGGAQT